MCCCGGEGMFSTTLTGPGNVYFQSMSFEKFKAAMTVYVQAQNAGAAGAGVATGMAIGAPERAEDMER